MSMEAYLREHPDADDEDLREALAGNLCRCTGYVGIIEAVKEARKLTS
jgi:carbon-monoxide dehydrogenase small subunit